MPKRAGISSILVIGAGICSAHVSAQDAVTLPLFNGALELRGEVAVLEDQRSDNAVRLKVWRPLLYRPGDKPIGGRMDCMLTGRAVPFSAEAFDVAARYAALRPARERARLEDKDPVVTDAGDFRSVEVAGRAFRPHRHYVQTWYALHEGERLYALQLDCDFAHIQDPRGEDYAADMHRYLSVAPPTQPSET